MKTVHLFAISLWVALVLASIAKSQGPISQYRRDNAHVDSLRFSRGQVEKAARHVPTVIDGAITRALADGDRSIATVWVFFADKGVGSDEHLRRCLISAEELCGEKARHRRSLRRSRPGLVDFDDLPVVEEYVRQVTATGARVRTVSPWLNAVSIEADRSQIDALARLPFVRRVKPLGLSVRIDPIDESIVTPAPLSSAGGFYGNATDQLTQINIPAAHSAGYTGAGVIIGVLDTGFKRSHEAFNVPGHVLNVLGERDFVNDDFNTDVEAGDISTQHSHGTQVLATIGAYKPNTLVGGAFDASFYLAKTEDIGSETPIEEDYYVAALQWLEVNGADVVTSSLGYVDWYSQSDLDGQTAVTTMAVNIATANGLACVTAAGNNFHDSNPLTSHLIAPADAFDVITCGAVDSSGNTVFFSSDGPTADGRVKPEFMARGLTTATISSSSDTAYTTNSGTSFSTPLIASGVALIVQAHPDWTVAQIRSALKRTASGYLANGTFDPNFVRGYGIVDILSAIEIEFIADGDADGDTDLDDWEGLQTCLGGPAVTVNSGCDGYDVDSDGDVDSYDVSRMMEGFTGPW